MRCSTCCAGVALPELICGVDEVGRGPLAGPVVAAAVILDPHHPIAGLAAVLLLLAFVGALVQHARALSRLEARVHGFEMLAAVEVSRSPAVG